MRVEDDGVGFWCQDVSSFFAEDVGGSGLHGIPLRGLRAGFRGAGFRALGSGFGDIWFQLLGRGLRVVF